jgi:hypothetical protein
MRTVNLVRVGQSVPGGHPQSQDAGSRRGEPGSGEGHGQGLVRRAANLPSALKILNGGGYEFG